MFAYLFNYGIVYYHAILR